MSAPTVGVIWTREGDVEITITAPDGRSFTVGLEPDEADGVARMVRGGGQPRAQRAGPGMTGTPLERLVVEHLTAHEGAWGLMAWTLRAINTDEDAGRYLQRHVRELMGKALIAGFDGTEPTPRRPDVDHYHKADHWIGQQLLRDLGPRALREVDWGALGGELTAFAGERICDRHARRAMVA